MFHGLAIIGTALALHGGAVAHQQRACPTPTQAITVVGSARGLRRVEAAVTIQSEQVASYWRTPCASFTSSGGWPVYLTSGQPQPCTSANAGESLACHGTSDNTTTGEPMAWVDASDSDWTVLLSHEVVEMLSDPYADWNPLCTGPGHCTVWTAGLEIADPFYDSSYMVGGVRVSNWALPNYYLHPFTARRVSFDGAS